MAAEFSWNPLALQPHSTLGRAEKLRITLASAPAYARMAGRALAAAAPVGIACRRRLAALYSHPVELPVAGFGLALDGTAAALEGELAACRELGVRQVLVRLPAWEMERLELYRRVLPAARADGFEFMVAVLQNRDMVRRPAEWRARLRAAFEALGGLASHFEIGHAWNRRKWGVFSYREYLRLLDGAEEARQGLAGIQMVGPAVIDFEFLQLASVVLARRRPRLAAISSLLYVDRRGPPEGRQLGLDLPRKAAMLRGLADCAPERTAPVWVTETNWPLAITGGFSPAGAREMVDEATGAAYLARYYLLALATGYVERVYWWTMTAPGFGLIDPSHGQWRRRPGFAAYAALMRHAAGGTVQRVDERPDHRVLMLAGGHGRPAMAIAWATAPGARLALASRVEAAWDNLGAEIAPPAGGELELGAAPVYLALGPTAARPAD